MTANEVTTAVAARPRWKRAVRWLAISAAAVVLLIVVALGAIFYFLNLALTPIIVEHDGASATAAELDSVKQIVAKAIGAQLPESAQAMRWSATTGPLQGDEEFVVLLSIDEELWRESVAAASSLDHKPRMPFQSPSDLEWASHAPGQPSATEEIWIGSGDQFLECWLVGPPTSRHVVLWFTDTNNMMPELAGWFVGGAQRRMR